jgi:hypothetical protein
MKWILSLLLLLTALTTRVEAQGLSPAVKYGKWLLLAGSIGMNYQAVRSHDRAENAFNALESRCFAAHDRCALGPGGTYADPEIEAFYQTSVRNDRNARRWLLGGESALVGAAALFIWELARPKARPGNIPFEPEVRSFRGGETGLGVRLAF